MKNNVTFSYQRCLQMFPGMLTSIDNLWILLTTEKNSNNTGGVLSALVFVCGHTIELLLKYKIGNENKVIEREHDLYKLFNLLSTQEKEKIKVSFRKLKFKHKISPTAMQTEEAEQTHRKMAVERFGMPKNYKTIKWNSIEGILELARKCHVDWRYAIEEGKGLLISPQALVLAVKSIYNTLDKT